MKVFLIDDDQLCLFLTENLLLLEDTTLDITTFLSATDALETMKAGNIPDFILLDLNMPVMDGWEFLDSLVPLETEIVGACKIYILTSSLDIADSVGANENPLIERLIHKPLERLDIKTILAHHRCT